MSDRVLCCVHACIVASYPSIFHTVSDKNLRRGKAGYEASTIVHVGLSPRYEWLHYIVGFTMFVVVYIYNVGCHGASLLCVCTQC